MDIWTEEEIAEFCKEPDGPLTYWDRTYYLQHLTDAQYQTLPKEWGDEVDLVLFNPKTQKTYPGKTIASWEKDDTFGTWTLQVYFYAAHTCDCHRGSHAVGYESNDECGDIGWVIDSVTHPLLPGINLYREVR